MGNGTRLGSVNVTWFFAFFSGVLDWIVLILVWFERSLHSAQVSGQSCPWPLKLMTSQAVERIWICMGGYGQVRGEWVKFHKLWQHVMTIDSVKHICLTVFLQSLEFLEKSWNLPSNFPDLEKVWKIEIKSWKNGKKSWVFFESCNKCITGEIFFCVGQILFSLACILFAVHHGKSFVPAFFFKGLTLYWSPIW